MNTATGEAQRRANMILVELKQDPNSWLKVGKTEKGTF